MIACAPTTPAPSTTPLAESFVLANVSQDVASIQYMAGHRDLHSTMRYTHGGLDGARVLLKAAAGLHSGQVSGLDEKKAPGRGA